MKTRPERPFFPRCFLCVHEPQTAPQSPRMGSNISEKQGVEWNLEQKQMTPKLFPDPTHWGMSDDVTGSDKTARPEVNKSTLFLGQNHVLFLFNMILKGAYLHAGHVSSISCTLNTIDP